MQRSRFSTETVPSSGWTMAQAGVAAGERTSRAWLRLLHAAELIAPPGKKTALRLPPADDGAAQKRSGQAEACPQSSQLYQEKVTGTTSTTCCRLHDNRDQFQRPLDFPKQRHELM